MQKHEEGGGRGCGRKQSCKNQSFESIKGEFGSTKQPCKSYGVLKHIRSLCKQCGHTREDVPCQQDAKKAMELEERHEGVEPPCSAHAEFKLLREQLVKVKMRQQGRVEFVLLWSTANKNGNPKKDPLVYACVWCAR